ncbi:hypothetical protein VBD025_16715 [Virgibacillus flavescens]|uniref:hypothetical protein n=1 Tax=Virgibacillus flavescens TaxID=1611422 RepID=UPI003D3533D6
MKILTLSLLIMASTLVACTSDENKDASGKTKQEDTTQVSNNDAIQNKNWDLSPTFEHTVVYESGKEGSYTVVGNEKTFGYSGPFPILAGKTQKYFWFYFGKENIYDKPVQVKALKKGTEEMVDIFEGTFYESAEVSPDSVNMPTHLHFPSAGVWKVLVYIEDEFYESIVVEVEE